jgi:hypothetical protein
MSSAMIATWATAITHAAMTRDRSGRLCALLVELPGVEIVVDIAFMILVRPVQILPHRKM